MNDMRGIKTYMRGGKTHMRGGKTHMRVGKTMSVEGDVPFNNQFGGLV